MNIFILLVVFMLSVEVMFWSFSINRHATWLCDNPMYDRRMAVPSKILALCGWITALLSISLWVWHVNSYAMLKMDSISNSDFYLKTFFICWVQISFIHLWAMLARYGCLHTQYWPIISGYISKFLIRKFQLTDINKYCSSMRKWDEIDKVSSQHRQILFKFADVMCDLIWTKDTKKRYTYVNKSMCRYVLILDTHTVIGLTHKQIADKLRSKGIAYDFDNASIKSDNEVLLSKKITRFLERGTINDKEVTLHVLKSPIFEKGKLVGIIGVARDVSDDIENLEKIDFLFKSGNYEQGIAKFNSYKKDFLDLKKYDSLHFYED